MPQDNAAVRVSVDPVLARPPTGGEPPKGFDGNKVEMTSDNVVEARKDWLKAVSERDKTPGYNTAVNEQIYRRHYRNLVQLEFFENEER